jgi:hypothetical protein
LIFGEINLMDEFAFSIIKWSAWAPGITTHEDFQQWAQGEKPISGDILSSPAIDKIPPLQRRRLSQLTKISLNVALNCTDKGEDIQSVFASRYGEWGQTLGLLESIAHGEDISPAGFSMSVHNTAAGIYSIINKNTAAYTAISGIDMTFDTALIETLGRLNGQENVLLVIAEEHVPDIYKNLFQKNMLPFGLGLLVGHEDSPGAIAKFSIKFQNNNLPSIHALDFLKFFLHDKGRVKSKLFEVKYAG